MTAYLELYQSFDPPYESFDNAMLGPQFPAELDLVSRLWFRCGYRPGIAAYLNFFLLRDFITTHDTSFPPRFKSLRSMANSFYQTDLFIREVTDSGAKPSGGISSRRVREQLKGIQDLERFARLIEEEQAAVTQRVPAHSRHILRIGEMIGVSSGPQAVLPMLPSATRALFEPLYPSVRPALLQRWWSRLLGRLLLPKAVGEPRRAVPLEG